ncbi:uncharacterized protein TNIN_91901 [Trichonephila inaurata madagascariensis]|uniref:Uncharacterized protein n=1 Tax=Trichonephila inaurata madagascariensis TaxID=2747483 RepID=A0A8X6Y7E9_9ARAC|nr:uncharacterized protein TNIN_91901 [Trichonephila inaurata madagascariensis]
MDILSQSIKWTCFALRFIYGDLENQMNLKFKPLNGMKILTISVEYVGTERFFFYSQNDCLKKCIDEDDSGTLIAILGVVIGTVSVLLLLGAAILLTIKLHSKRRASKERSDSLPKVIEVEQGVNPSISTSDPSSRKYREFQSVSYPDDPTLITVREYFIL